MSSAPFALVSKIPEESHTQQQLHNLTIVASGKGGVGKTWLSIHLAHALGEKHRQVLLIDGDFGLANIDVQLGLMPEVDLSQVLKGYAHLEEALLTQNPGRFHLLPGQSGMNEFSNLSPSKVALFKSLLNQQSKNYHHLFLDLGAGIGPLVTNFVPLASRVIVVITPDPTSLTDAYALIKVIRQNFPKVKLHVTTNQVTSSDEGRKIYTSLCRACENFLNFRPHHLGYIPKEQIVAQAIRAQTLLPKISPSSAAWRKIKEISKKLF